MTFRFIIARARRFHLLRPARNRVGTEVGAERHKLEALEPELVAEAAAYAWIVQARQAVAQLAETAGTRTQVSREDFRQDLAQAAQELGMAGYLVSERLPAATRHALLEKATARHHASMQGGGQIQQQLGVLLRAAHRALEKALTVPELSDHVLLAAERVELACELVDRTSAAIPTAPSPQAG